MPYQHILGSARATMTRGLVTASTLPISRAVRPKTASLLTGILRGTTGGAFGGTGKIESKCLVACNFGFG